MSSKFLNSLPGYKTKPAPKSVICDDLPQDGSLYKKLWKNLLTRKSSNITLEPDWFTYSKFLAWAKDHHYEHGYFCTPFLKTPTNNAVLADTALLLPRDIWGFVKPNRSTDTCKWRGTVEQTQYNTTYIRAVGYFRRQMKDLGQFQNREEAHFAWLAWKIRCGYVLLAELDPRCWQVKEAFIAHLNRMEAHLEERKEFKL